LFGMLRVGDIADVQNERGLRQPASPWANHE
jgi:hypothetical protein